MLVVADSSPLQALVLIEHVDLLGAMFASVAVPPEVVNELSQPQTPEKVRQFLRAAPAWLTVQVPESVAPISGIQVGEVAAIALAMHLSADAILIDDRDGRRAARARGLAVIGTIGVLERAADSGLISLADAFDRLRRTDFRISSRLLAARLAEHQRRMRDCR